MNEQEFEERKRDIFIIEAAYDEYLKVQHQLFSYPDYAEDRNVIIATRGSKEKARSFSFSRARQMIEFAWVMYSCGLPIEEIHSKVIYAFDDLERHLAVYPDDTFKLWEPDAYYFCMLLISWTVLFNMPERLPLIASFISQDEEDGLDPFIAVLFHSLGIRNFSGANAPLQHPKPYVILYESLREDRAGQAKAMGKYLKAWYKGKSIKNCYWHGRHEGRVPENHLGYWAFEKGMLTVLNNLDDSSFRDMNYYPRDLIDYSRKHGWIEEFKKAVTEWKTT
ncbi:PoNe immunity protein domain-containing protein [Desulfovibrio litoralis]|uniref:PoNi C-terminal domain-containing protein n=1 Tax=Desulfovibrio litoralis DSM 11393 TaxID=1121455 RepID=A0A1M7S0X9_9BACT|nr:PoNe immunity protein domain-containing protein [Desulfovibrio litoralis]SHN52055.1 protein of unknown function [Desulfovibrio litoralis DSM 11393]